MPPHNRQGAGADEKTFGPPVRPVDDKPFVMPQDPFAQLRGPYGETFTDETEESGDSGPEHVDLPDLILTGNSIDDAIVALVDRNVSRDGKVIFFQKDDRYAILELVMQRRSEKL